MSEHDDDLESEVTDDAGLEADEFPDLEDELEDVDNDDPSKEDEDANVDEDEAEL